MNDSGHGYVQQHHHHHMHHPLFSGLSFGGFSPLSTSSTGSSLSSPSPSSTLTSPLPYDGQELPELREAPGKSRRKTKKGHQQQVQQRQVSLHEVLLWPSRRTGPSLLMSVCVCFCLSACLPVSLSLSLSLSLSHTHSPSVCLSLLHLCFPVSLFKSLFVSISSLSSALM